MTKINTKRKIANGQNFAAFFELKISTRYLSYNNLYFNFSLTTFLLGHNNSGLSACLVDSEPCSLDVWLALARVLKCAWD